MILSFNKTWIRVKCFCKDDITFVQGAVDDFHSETHRVVRRKRILNKQRVIHVARNRLGFIAGNQPLETRIETHRIETLRFNIPT